MKIFLFVKNGGEGFNSEEWLKWGGGVSFRNLSKKILKWGEGVGKGKRYS